MNEANLFDTFWGLLQNFINFSHGEFKKMSTIKSAITRTLQQEINNKPVFTIDFLLGKSVRVYWNVELQLWSVKIGTPNAKTGRPSFSGKVDGYIDQLPLRNACMVLTKKGKDGLSNATAHRKAVHADITGVVDLKVLDNSDFKKFDLYRFSGDKEEFIKNASYALLSADMSGNGYIPDIYIG